MDISFRWTFPLAFSQGKRFRQQQFGGAQNFLGVFWGPNQDLASNLIIVLLLSMSVDLQIFHLSSVRYIRQECLGMYLGFDLMFTLFDCEFNLSLDIHSAFNSLVRIKFISLLDEFSNKQHKVEYMNFPFRNKTQVRLFYLLLGIGPFLPASKCFCTLLSTSLCQKITFLSFQQLCY